MTDAFIALGSNCAHLGKIEAVQIDEKDINQFQFNLEKENGDTPTNGINDKHYNITNLNFESLGRVIQSIIFALNNGRYVKKSRSDMKRLLIAAHQEAKIDWDRLEPTLRAELEKI